MTKQKGIEYMGLYGTHWHGWDDNVKDKSLDGLNFLKTDCVERILIIRQWNFGFHTSGGGGYFLRDLCLFEVLHKCVKWFACLLTYLLTYILTHSLHAAVLLEKLTVSQLFKKFGAF